MVNCFNHALSTRLLRVIIGLGMFQIMILIFIDAYLDLSTEDLSYLVV